MASCWLILAAALDPLRFLSYGTAVVTAASTLVYNANLLYKTAASFRAAFVNHLMRVLASSLTGAQIRISRQKLTRYLLMP